MRDCTSVYTSSSSRLERRLKGKEVLRSSAADFFQTTSAATELVMPSPLGRLSRKGMIMQDTSSLPPGLTSEQHGESLVLPTSGFVRQKLLLHFIPFSKSTLWRQVNAGLFPAPVPISPGITAWRAEEVRRWIAERR
ncbi:AlpA family phage regulatory protein [Acidovorax sp. 210-6]|uniref:helix-turn-helix transcriptional regulator n=1 Tax=Acidovorax sp. 210-6 TaxID=2699468 RepID=UPI003221AD65